MANYIEYDTLFDSRIPRGRTCVVPSDLGYIIVQLYGIDKTKKPHQKVAAGWIGDNLNGNWTTFTFGVPTDGQGYCFLDEEDVLAFKLRWA